MRAKLVRWMETALNGVLGQHLVAVLERTAADVLDEWGVGVDGVRFAQRVLGNPMIDYPVSPTIYLDGGAAAQDAWHTVVGLARNNAPFSVRAAAGKASERLIHAAQRAIDEYGGDGGNDGNYGNRDRWKVTKYNATKKIY